MVVLAGRIHHQLRLIFIQNRQHQVVKDVQKAFFPGPRRQWHVYIVPNRSRPAELIQKASSRI